MDLFIYIEREIDRQIDRQIDVDKIQIYRYRYIKQKRGTAIGRKFAPPYSILFMAELE